MVAQPPSAQISARHAAVAVVWLSSRAHGLRIEEPSDDEADWPNGRRHSLRGTDASLHACGAHGPLGTAESGNPGKGTDRPGASTDSPGTGTAPERRTASASATERKIVCESRGVITRSMHTLVGSTSGSTILRNTTTPTGNYAVRSVRFGSVRFGSVRFGSVQFLMPPATAIASHACVAACVPPACVRNM
jgi:hypothetical protein